MIEANVIHAAHVVGVDRLMFLGSSCIYPKLADQLGANAGDAPSGRLHNAFVARTG